MLLTLKAPKIMKMDVVEFANSIDPDEVAHHDRPHLGLTLFAP